MTKIKRKLNSVLVLVMVVTLLCNTAAFAAGSCSLRIIVRNDGGDPVQNINVELYSVAHEENGGFAFTSDFADLGISAQELADQPTQEHAEAVFQYVYARELEGIIKQTSASGVAEFHSLEKGIYLVLDRGDQIVAFEPYLVVLPTEINGRPESNVTSIPKTSATETKALSVFKLWDDDMNAAGKRPANLEVTVFRDGAAIRKATLNEANNWQHVFHMLPNQGTYAVQEAPITDYKAEYVPVAEGCLLINTFTGSVGGGGGGGGGGGEEPIPQPAHISVTKVWDDNNDAAGKRPDTVTVQLVENNTVIKTAPLSYTNGWRYTFNNLDPTKSYTVQEIPVPGYSASYVGNAATGIIITNQYTETTDPGTPPPPIIPEPAKIDIPVKVEWVDNDNAEGLRPNLVTVHLIADGSIIASVQLSPDNHWESVFTGVPADLYYTVWQTAVEDYTTTYAGNAVTGFVVTNTYTKNVTDPGTPPDPTLPVEPQPQDPVIPPDVPVGPTIPQTGAEVLPVYLLMAAGVLLVLLGVIDLYKGRENP